jgi:hypothetical protein
VVHDLESLRWRNALVNLREIKCEDAC